MKLSILAAALVLAACSSTSPASSGGTPSTPGTPSAPAATTPGATGASSPAFAPAGDLVYGALPADRGDALVLPVLHTIRADGTTDKRLPLSAMGAVWSADGRRLLVNGLPLGATVLPWRPAVTDEAGGHVRKFRLPGLPDEVNNCRWAPEEKYLVCDIAAGVVRIDATSFRTTMLALGGENQVWDVSPAGLVAFARQASGSDGIEDAELYTINVDGTGRRKLTDFGKVLGTYDDAGGAWLPDGSAIVTGTPDGRLVRVDAKTGELTEIKLDKRLFASRPAVSRDGTLIAFEARGNGQDIYVTRVTGGPVARVAGTKADEVRPQWRPATGGMMN